LDICPGGPRVPGYATGPDAALHARSTRTPVSATASRRHGNEKRACRP